MNKYFLKKFFKHNVFYIVDLISLKYSVVMFIGD